MWFRARAVRGQAIVEYILLLTIVVTLSAFIMAQMVSRDPENPGFLISFWGEVLQQIGLDDPHQK
ncbi:MAG: hypothetical protein NZ480_07255 [Bdellovibrionaceae bacterium]|nr:hypothetical protein [Pseudobdellovibrionaceae bacterium]MDW8191028.1 hypothetical protein [Pseudobdellovibrionaceae bacterium]